MTDDERLRRKEEENFVINMLGEKNKNSFNGEKLLNCLTSNIARVKGRLYGKSRFKPERNQFGV